MFSFFSSCSSIIFTKFIHLVPIVTYSTMQLAFVCVLCAFVNFRTDECISFVTIRIEQLNLTNLQHSISALHIAATSLVSVAMTVQWFVFRGKTIVQKLVDSVCAWTFMGLGVAAVGCMFLNEKAVFGPMAVWVWWVWVKVMLMWSCKMLKYQERSFGIKCLIKSRSRLEYSPSRIPMFSRRHKMIEEEVCCSPQIVPEE